MKPAWDISGLIGLYLSVKLDIPWGHYELECEILGVSPYCVDNPGWRMKRILDVALCDWERSRR